MKFQGFVGPSYKLDSVNVDAQRCVNMYPELIESGAGKEGQQYYLKSTPGLTKQFTVGSGPIRCIHIDIDGKILVVSGNKFYKVIYDGTSWTSTEKGTLNTSTGPVKAESSIGAGGDQHITTFVDGNRVYGYVFYPSAPTLDAFGRVWGDFGATLPFPADGATHIVQIDGYYIYNVKDSNTFFVSPWGDAQAVNPLDFASAEGDPDKIMGHISLGRSLWLINEETSEVFANNGNADFPFERVGGGFFEKGTCARYSIAKVDKTLFWLARDKSGRGSVVATQGGDPQRISTHAVEQAISGYADITTATGFGYQKNGHYFYQLNFAEATWVYDLSTKLWHERAYTGTTSLERHRSDCHAYYKEYDLQLVGDYSNGNVYSLEESVYTDDGNPITRLRSFPHISSGLKRLYCNRLQLDMETGIGLVSGQGSDPQVVLDWSDDGGHTWSDESWTSAGGKIGGVGDFKKRVIWRRLGKFFDRVFRIQITDPVPVTLMSVEIEIKAGNS